MFHLPADAAQQFLFSFMYVNPQKTDGTDGTETVPERRWLTGNRALAGKERKRAAICDGRERDIISLSIFCTSARLFLVIPHNVRLFFFRNALLKDVYRRESKLSFKNSVMYGENLRTAGSNI